MKACFEIQLGLLIGLLASALCLEMLCSRKMMVMLSFLFDVGGAFSSSVDALHVFDDGACNDEHSIRIDHL